ncbi:hypothetical protein D3C73_1015380 [compost metagenome]
MHPAVTRLEGAELDARQPQTRNRLHILHQHLGWCFRAAVLQDCLEFFQQFGVLCGGGVGQGFLDFEQHGCAMFAVGAYRAGAGGIDHQQCGFG